MGMYESPIKIIYGQMQTQLEGDILKAVMSTDIQVDKYELTRALQYDRDQYERGFADGYMKAQQEVVRCKDCNYGAPCEKVAVLCWLHKVKLHQDAFCSYGERKDNEK